MKKITIVLTIVVIMLAVTGCSAVDYIQTSFFPVATPEPVVEATPEPTPTITPTPQPTPEPTPDQGPYGDGMYVVETYDNSMPTAVAINYKYRKQDDYLAYMNYIVMLQDSHVYSEMNAMTEPIMDADYGDRFEISARLVVYEDIDLSWYRVHWTETVEDEATEEEIEVERFGYVNSTVADYRTFQLADAFSKTIALSQDINDESTMYVYVDNRNNENGLPPDSGRVDEYGKTVDAYGVLQDQAAPAYAIAAMTGEFRYIPDGTIAKILDIEKYGAAHVYLPQYDAEYYIPSEYMKYYYSEPKSMIDTLTECIVIDRTNQNIMYFEVDSETAEWEVLSMSFASTGAHSDVMDPTPLGIYAVQKVRISQEYDFDSRPGVRAGYMPYVILFSGGAYIHGVPTNYRFDDAGVMTKPSPRESHSSIGVTPQSHMCVRNYTSHAEFLYDRVDAGHAVVFVIE